MVTSPLTPISSLRFSWATWAYWIWLSPRATVLAVCRYGVARRWSVWSCVTKYWKIG